MQEDIDKRRQAEKALLENERKLVRSKKMESIGLLAGGVAHDLNNVLSGILSYPELILMDLSQDSKLRKPIENIKGSGESILIVDDVESQREMSCKMLEALGYKIRAVSSGEEAVEYLKEQSVDLILLDMIMD